MINYWWVTRPKRKLNSVPEVLASVADNALNQEWAGQHGIHLSFEDALEEAGLKRRGDRRDQTGGGARTYIAWLASLGLVFVQENSKKLRLTLAGEAIMAGDSPVSVLKNQIIKYQFPSSYSLSQGVQVSPRFKLRPFRFLLRLLADESIEFLSKDEIAKIIIVKAENETERCYKETVARILEYRANGDACLDGDFFEKYAPSKGSVHPKAPFGYLMDIANTIINWMEYTQLAKRDENRLLRIIPDKAGEVANILGASLPFIDRPEQHEHFQRKYGLDPKHRKDTRNLSESQSITTQMLAEYKVKQAFFGESLKAPVGRITAGLIDAIAEQTGFDAKFVEETLLRLYPHGAIGSFMSEYFEMAFKGRDEAIGFEKATVELFKTILGFDARHIGPIGLTPDVLLLSNSEGYCAILDNKAYSRYTISNDHRNRMVYNYINGLGNYYSGSSPLAFFSYIAGGFGANINAQICDISTETSIRGSAVGVSNIIALVEKHTEHPFSHRRIRDIFSLNRQVLLADLTQ